RGPEFPRPAGPFGRAFFKPAGFKCRRARPPAAIAGDVDVQGGVAVLGQERGAGRKGKRRAVVGEGDAGRERLQFAWEAVELAFAPEVVVEFFVFIAGEEGLGGE